MDSYDADTSSFVIKVWIEEHGDDKHDATWRGHITHVSSGKRQYFQGMDRVSAFIWSYLEEMGVMDKDHIA